MATYKLIQDIEAEDKLVGPLSFRQFVYGLIAAFFIYISVLCVAHRLFLFILVFLPPGLFTGFLAFPFRKDQPTEVWALAKLRFIIKPHKRIWNQSGVKEMVTVTAPKKIEIVRTDGLNQTEVESRLRALADTIDSRGWAIKNVNVNMYSQPNQLINTVSDRLVDISSMPQEVPNYDIQASDDMLDEQSNPVAQHVEQMINASENAHRQHIINELSDSPVSELSAQATAQGAAPENFWFMQPAAPTPPTDDKVTFTSAQVISPHTVASKGSGQPVTANDQALLARLKSQRPQRTLPYNHMRTLQPLNSSSTNDVTVPAASPVTHVPDPAILSLANNNDLNVATLAREAHKATTPDESSQDEVVISLH